MQLRVMTEPQEGGTYDDLVRLARQAEDLGFDGFFRSDHLQRISSGDPGPGSTDAWITLAGLARETSRLRLGTMVTSATFRRPGLLAIMVATVDAMSGGRVELGLGSGWFEAEHTSYGVPFPAVGERFDVLEEQLQVITGLWGTPVGETFSHTGTHYTVVDSPALPKPVQAGGIPIIIGGMGKTRTPDLAVRFASEFNMPPARDLPSTAEQFDRVRAACERAQRDPSSIVLSTAQPFLIGSDDRDVARRAAAVGWEVDTMRRLGLFGTAEQIIDKLGALAELGSTRTYFQLQDLQDEESLVRVAEEVMPHLAV